ncbi:MAG: Crp/Fnr family transcriptional regulator [Calditrichaeota bacterium]|nr:MAG: Crp/Fnr family transcriptional regulator [Calditrichota bacterium]
MSHTIESVLPFLEQADPGIRREFEQHALVETVYRGKIMILEGEPCKSMYIVVDGAIRVFKSSDSGREITLYQVRSGESCTLTAFSIINNSPFPAMASAERPTRIVKIPAEIFREWVQKYDVWREYVFQLLADSLTEIIHKVESLAFRRVDERLAELLVHAAGDEQGPVKMTHSAIARELGTAREVVSRILKDFEKARFVTLSRGNITVINPDALLKRTAMWNSRQ